MKKPGLRAVLWSLWIGGVIAGSISEQCHAEGRDLSRSPSSNLSQSLAAQLDAATRRAYSGAGIQVELASALAEEIGVEFLADEPGRRLSRLPKSVSDGSAFALTSNGPGSQSAVGPSDGQWEILVTPDFWLAGLEGEITVKGLSADLDIGFSDIVDHFDYGGALHIDARRGKWSILGDVLFMKLSGDEAVKAQIAPLMNQGIIPPIFMGQPLGGIQVDVEVEMTVFLAELGVAHRVATWPLGSEASDRTLGLDVLGGARYWYMKGELDFDIEAQFGPITRSIDQNVDKSKDWIDPFVGGRVDVDLTERLSLFLRGDVGGFDVGSVFTWKATGLLNYQMTPRLSFYGGYQVLDVDYEDGSGSNEIALDARMEGLLLGLAFRFVRPEPITEPGSDIVSSIPEE